MRQADSVSPIEKQQPQHSEQKTFRADIEGLRAVAVTAVVLFHAAVPGINGGYVGVDVFFVISGFLITGLLWREVSGTGSVRLRSFYGARARRLLMRGVPQRARRGRSVDREQKVAACGRPLSPPRVASLRALITVKLNFGSWPT